MLEKIHKLIEGPAKYGYGTPKVMAIDDRVCVVIYDCVTRLHANANMEFYIASRALMPKMLKVLEAVKAHKALSDPQFEDDEKLYLALAALESE